MAEHRLMAAFLGAALLAAGAAHAESATTLPAAAFTTRDAFSPDDLNRWAPQAGRRSLQWDSKKAKWGLKLDLDQQVGRPLSPTSKDVQAGAFFKVTPSFRVGGAVSLGSFDNDPQTVIPPDKAPKVKLETALKF